MRRLAAILFGCLSACSLKLDFEGLSGGAVDAASDGQATDGAVACPSGRGPAMVRVGAFCIDSTEVTNTQYAVFLVDAARKRVDQHPACGFNTDLTPTSRWPASTDRNNHPVGDIDWCDAWAYCRWAGKHLCGAIAGGPARYDAPNDLSSQWYFACTRGVGPTRRYPYGPEYRAGVCRGDLGESAGAAAVATQPECVGGGDGIFDMSGNVWEWEDACAADVGPTDVCAFRGGSWGSSASLLACAGRSPTELLTRRDTREKIGVRCCAR